MDTPVTALPRRGLTPVQRSMFLPLLLALAWSALIGQIFHSFRLLFMCLMATWMTAIVLQPARPLPWWCTVLSTLGGAVGVSLIFYVFVRLGWP